MAAGTLTPAAMAVFGVIVVMIALVGEVTRRVFRPQAAGSAAADPGASAALLGSPMALRMLGLLQFVTAVIAVFVPLAAALYLLVTVSWTLVQRVLLRRVHPLPEPRTA